MSGPSDRLAWLSGHWVNEGTSETWVAVGPALFGVGMGVRGKETAFFEVMTLTVKDGSWTYTAMPNGLRAVSFSASDIGDGHASFENPANEFPQRIRYERRDDHLHTLVAGAGKPDNELVLERRRLPGSPELEALDRRFSADSATRGGRAWADIFEPDGATWSQQNGRTAGAEAIGKAMEELYSGGLGLEWRPLASGVSGPGDRGFTIGRYRLLEPEKNAAAGTGERNRPSDTDTDTDIANDIDRPASGGALVYRTVQSGHYVTIWHRQPNGDWRVSFDTGVPDPET